MSPHHINPVQWQQNVGLARQACARIFRDGGKPADALDAFGIGADTATVDWRAAVDRIATTLSSTRGLRKAA